MLRAADRHVVTEHAGGHGRQRPHRHAPSIRRSRRRRARRGRCDGPGARTPPRRPPRMMPATHSPMRPPACSGSSPGQPRPPIEPHIACKTNSLTRPLRLGERAAAAERRHRDDDRRRLTRSCSPVCRQGRSVGEVGDDHVGGREELVRRARDRGFLSGGEVAEQRAGAASGSPRNRQCRIGSPSSGSIFTTSAPASASILPQYAAAMPDDSSTTRSPANGSCGAVPRETGVGHRSSCRARSARSAIPPPRP